MARSMVSANTSQYTVFYWLLSKPESSMGKWPVYKLYVPESQRSGVVTCLKAIFSLFQPLAIMSDSAMTWVTRHQNWDWSATSPLHSILFWINVCVAVLVPCSAQEHIEVSLSVYSWLCGSHQDMPVARCTRAVSVMGSGTVTACWAPVSWPRHPPAFSLASGSMTGRRDTESTMTSPGLINGLAQNEKKLPIYITFISRKSSFTSCGVHSLLRKFPLRLLVLAWKPWRLNCALVFPVFNKIKN